ncbi:conjugal transfer protein [Streptomyces xiamenensis]|uniref:conjugal transfer protein n=1 Tax=Streptomyces xiamenensis TaxID=408015 RepID=UPI0035DB869B
MGESQELVWRATTGSRANGAVLARVGVWGLVVAGPLLSVVALTKPSESAPVVAAPLPADVVVGDPVGPAGFAELYLRAFLEGDPQAAGAELAPFYPAARSRVLDGGRDGVAVRHSGVVSSDALGGGYWSVLVGARVAEEIPAAEGSAEGTSQEQLRYFRVPVVAVEGGWEATAYPAEVVAPVSNGQRQADYAVVALSAHDPAAVALQDFFAAYLTGVGDVSRYLAPGGDPQAVWPPPYVEIAVVSVAARSAGDGVLELESGAQEQLLVEVEARSAGGRMWPLSYSVVLAERDGRWEIGALEAAPQLVEPAQGLDTVGSEG